MTAPNYAQFTIDAVAVVDDRGYVAAPSDVLTLALEVQPNPALDAVFALYDPTDMASPLASLSAPLLTFVGSGTASERITDPVATVQFALPGSGFHSYVVRCTATLPDGAHTYERLVVVRSSSAALRKTVPGESTEFAQRGFSDALNELTEAVEAAGGGGGGLTPVARDFATASVALSPNTLNVWETNEGSTGVTANMPVGTDGDVVAVVVKTNTSLRVRLVASGGNVFAADQFVQTAEFHVEGHLGQAIFVFVGNAWQPQDLTPNMAGGSAVTVFTTEPPLGFPQTITLANFTFQHFEVGVLTGIGDTLTAIANGPLMIGPFDMTAFPDLLLFRQILIRPANPVDPGTVPQEWAGLWTIVDPGSVGTPAVLMRSTSAQLISQLQAFNLQVLELATSSKYLLFIPDPLVTFAPEVSSIMTTLVAPYAVGEGATGEGVFIAAASGNAGPTGGVGGDVFSTTGAGGDSAAGDGAHGGDWPLQTGNGGAGSAGQVGGRAGILELLPGKAGLSDVAGPGTDGVRAGGKGGDGGDNVNAGGTGGKGGPGYIAGGNGGDSPGTNGDGGDALVDVGLPGAGAGAAGAKGVARIAQNVEADHIESGWTATGTQWLHYGGQLSISAVHSASSSSGTLSAKESNNFELIMDANAVLVITDSVAGQGGFVRINSVGGFTLDTSAFLRPGGAMATFPADAVPAGQFLLEWRHNGAGLMLWDAGAGLAFS